MALALLSKTQIICLFFRKVFSMVYQLHILMYCKIGKVNEQDEVIFSRAYKYLDKPKNITPRFSHIVYSHKAKKYVTAAFYTLDWKGNQLKAVGMPNDILRAAILRIGLDTR